MKIKWIEMRNTARDPLVGSVRFQMDRRPPINLTGNCLYTLPFDFHSLMPQT
jgi:hypothetical protein